MSDKAEKPNYRGEEINVSEIIGRVYEKRNAAARFNPVSGATECMVECGFTSNEHATIYKAAHNHFVHRFEAYLRGKFGTTSRPNVDAALNPEFDWNGKLQDRYPAADKSGDYVLRYYMQKSDYDMNEDRLRKASASLAKHADALLGEREGRFGIRSDTKHKPGKRRDRHQEPPTPPVN